MSERFDKDGFDKDLPDEQQLDEYLRGGSAVSRQYRELPGADVPTELDRLVLRQAQEAVKARPAKSRTWVRWGGPLALAASAVLVVSIVIESGVHEDTYLTVPASAPAEVSVQEEKAAQSKVIPDQPPEQAVRGNASEPNVVHIVPPSEPASQRAAPPAPMMMDEAAPAEDLSLAIQPQTLQPVAPQFTSPPPPVAPTDTVETTARRIAPAQTHASVSAPVSVLENEQLEEVIMTGAKRREQKHGAGPRNTVVPAAAADSARETAKSEADESRDYSDPEQWLRDIRELRKENKHSEADREWRRFRYVFPNYEVAEDDTARGAQR